MDKRTNVITKNPINFIGTRFLKLYLLIGFILRIILMWNVPEDSSFSLWEIIRFLSVGFVTDICMAILLALPLQIINLGLNEAKYHRVTGWIIELLLSIAFAYVLFFHTIFHEYGGGAPKIARIFLGWKLFSFSIRFFIPRTRETWRKVSLYTPGLYMFSYYFASQQENTSSGESLA